jgi:anaerobic magnesium-protoporphyrin IX monomethyl ester cyclase
MAKDRFDVAFMFPPGNEFRYFKLRSFEHHLGVAYIQAYLAKHGFTSKQVTPSLGSTLSDCVEQLIATDAKIIGFTCYDSNYFLIRTIASLIKRRKPETIVIAGGPTATFSDDLLLNNSSDIDICVRFEGEKTTLELVSRNTDRSLLTNIEDVAGITYRHNTSIVRTPDRPLFGASNNKEFGLDDLPSPYLEAILDGTEGAGILTARGCTHHCTYCNFSAMSKHTIRYHSIDRVIAELEYIYNSGTSHSKVVMINDDAFTLNVRRAKEICKRIINKGIKLELSCLCRADNLDRELIELLNEAGFVDISFGVESAVPRVLHNIKKVHRIEQNFDKEDYASEKRFLSKIKEGIALAKSYGMKTSVSIILGLPGETANDGLKTIEFIRSLGVDFYEHNYLTLFPGTELFSTANNYGIKFKPSKFLLPFDTHHAYPVHEIPFENNSSLHDLNQELARIILKTFTGVLDIYESSNNGVILISIESDQGDSFFNSLRWLSKTIAVGGRVVILGNENDTIDDSDLVLKASYNIGLPTGEYYYLKKCSISSAESIYEIINKPLHGQLLQYNPRFPLVRLVKCLEFSKKHNLTRTQIYPIYCIKEMCDVKFLAIMADMIAKQVNNGNIGQKFWLDGVFLDGCRWSKNLCPALKLQRITISRTGEILPCLTGQPIGDIKDSIQDLRNNARNIYEKMREERKCAKCPADSWCSKCLFPYPIDQEEYCELQKSNSNISEMVTRSNLVNTVDLGQ